MDRMIYILLHQFTFSGRVAYCSPSAGSCFSNLFHTTSTPHRLCIHPFHIKSIFACSSIDVIFPTAFLVFQMVFYLGPSQIFVSHAWLVPFSSRVHTNQVGFSLYLATEASCLAIASSVNYSSRLFLCSQREGQLSSLLLGSSQNSASLPMFRCHITKLIIYLIQALTGCY